MFLSPSPTSPITQQLSACTTIDRLDLLQTFRTIFRLLVCFVLPILFVYNIELQATVRNSNTTMTKTTLPPPTQIWAHAVSDRKTLIQVLQDDQITAIETDLLMGTLLNSSQTTTPIPIMAHPPNKQSDLSMKDFLLLASNTTSQQVQKVLKLDFKEPETVEPTLQAIADLKLETSDTAAILLNADVLPGPGKRQEGDVTIPATSFLETCLPYIAQSPARIAFSLGYKTDCTDLDGYTQEDVQAMAHVLEQYQLVELGIGVVLALNARQLAKNVERFDSILARFPELQLLIWTGKGEPAIPQSLLRSLQDHYRQRDLSERIGYDCQVTGSYVVGMSTELVVSSLGYGKLIMAGLSITVVSSRRRRVDA